MDISLKRYEEIFTEKVSVKHTMEWLNGIVSYTPLEFAGLQYKFMPKVLKRAYGIVE